MTPGWFKVLFGVVGFVFFCAGVFHGLAVFFPNISEPLPTWEHGLFVLINWSMAGLWFLRVKWLPWAFLGLTMQQLWQHGGDLVHALQETPPRVDWQSVFALGGLIPMWLLLRAWVRAGKP